MENITLKSPCYLNNRNATDFYRYVKTLSNSVFMTKISTNRIVDCSSLIGILSLCVGANDEIKISSYNKEDLDSVLKHLKSLSY